MAWYNTGTIALTNGSATVTGSGTNFLVGAQIGEALYAPDGKLYEIQTINSATVITLASNYLGSTASGQGYQIIPTQSLVADLASDVTDLISDFADVRDYAGNGKFNDGAVGTPGITFTQDQDNGLYRIGSNNWALAAGGQKIVDISTSGIGVTGSVTASSTLTAQKLVSADGILELDDNGTHNGIINSPASLIINIDSDNNNAGENFIIAKDRTSTSGGTELFRVQENGNVGIGVTPSASSATTNIELPYGATLSSRSNTTAPQFAMMSNAVGNWYEPTYKINGFATQYLQQGNDGTHAWSTAASGTAGNAITFTPAMTLDASGNLLVGKTSSDTNVEGSVLFADSSSGAAGAFTSDGNRTIIANRKTDDGEIISIRKDGTTVGSIGSISGVVSYINLDPRSGGTGIAGTNTDSIIPVTGTGAVANGTKDLGLTTARWRDLHLSGGVVFGDAGGSGTPSSNTLDSYEEGTFTATLTATTSAPTTAATATAYYTKVGNLVTVFIRFSNKDTSGASGDMSITGLPFTSKNVTENQAAVPMMHNLTISDKYVTGYISGSTTFINFINNLSNSAWTSTQINASTGVYLNMNMTYQVA
jgi:hypothetical protein